MTQNEENNEQEVTQTASENLLVVPPRATEEVRVVDKKLYAERAFAVLGAFAVTGLLVVSTAISWKKAEPEVVSVIPKIQENVPKPPDIQNPFNEIQVGAKAVIVYDVYEKRVLYGMNEKKALPLASLTKLMTSLLAVESFEDSKKIAISSKALETEGDSGLFANESWKVRDLVSFMMITSSNDGADALATAVGALQRESTPEVPEGYVSAGTFVDMMNSRALELGLISTRFMNPTGLDSPNGGGVGSAQDVSKLLTYIWENEPNAITYTNKNTKNFISEDGFLHTAENTNEIVYDIPGLIGGKTGYTDLAGGNLAVIYDAGLNHPIVIVVLGSTKDGRFTDVKKLVDATYTYNASGWAEYEKVAGSTALSVDTKI